MIFSVGKLRPAGNGLVRQPARYEVLAPMPNAFATPAPPKRALRERAVRVPLLDAARIEMISAVRRAREADATRASALDSFHVRTRPDDEAVLAMTADEYERWLDEECAKLWHDAHASGGKA
jgi:hypothetical protein